MMATHRRGTVSAAGKSGSKSTVSSKLHSSEGSEGADLSKKMALQEKLDFIDSEIRKLHVFCTKSGYSSSQIESFAKPFFDRDSHHFSTCIWASGKAWKRRAVALTTMIVATALLFRYDPAYRLASALSKQGAIQILPLWDWSQLHETGCWVENPLYRDLSGLQLSDCEICEGTEKIERVNHVTGQDLMDRYVRRDQPIIVEDGARSWSVAKNFSIPRLAQIYEESPILRRYSSCKFSSNVRIRHLDHINLLDKVTDGKLDHFYAQWENCNTAAARAFRSFYTRPYFLPPTVALSPTNLVFISANYTAKMYKPIDVRQSLMMFIQIKGESQVRLQPWEPCSGYCSTLEEVLHQGEILVATDFMWEMDYLPSSSTENIAIALGGTFD